MENESSITKELKRKKGPIDRTESRYSVEEFLSLSRDEQIRLAEDYMFRESDRFDDGMFKFSRTTFFKICKEIGIEKGIVDKRVGDTVIYIEHGCRREKKQVKLMLEEETLKKLDTIFGDSVSTQVRSKVMEVVLSEALDRLVKAKETGCLEIFYKPVEAEKIL